MTKKLLNCSNGRPTQIGSVHPKAYHPYAAIFSQDPIAKSNRRQSNPTRKDALRTNQNGVGNREKSA